ncbi:hypothetical protein [Candidatus Venteria ishoeyi]|uniref:Type VI secretion lipoprotein n=1 Tax=Candidatus Venteria ishoeyi TaxID=1899563 RepID=A0A1H6FBF2_9GAMM|nr:hypothetical protein [Candidatus Venteria ishoeyi]MDM8545142.1 hypothetical protein [Candidatus Venteria ishoeyi]SEH06659.1 Uncharacterised protein [Candidatus Venteria ishoeyi]
MKKQNMRLWLYLVILMFLTSCGSNGTRAGISKVKTRLFAIDVSQRANLNHPVALDLVIAYNQSLFLDLLKISAKEWFKKRQQYKMDYPAALQSWEWELVPGQVVPFFKLPKTTRKGVGAVVFANYVSPGNHRARIDPYEGVVVRLNESDFSISSLR